jgi:hypothetical protein
VAGDKPSDETAGSSREELTLDEDAVKLKEKEKRKSEDDLSSATREKRKDSGYNYFVNSLKHFNRFLITRIVFLCVFLVVGWE